MVLCRMCGRRFLPPHRHNNGLPSHAIPVGENAGAVRRVHMQGDAISGCGDQGLEEVAGIEPDGEAVASAGGTDFFSCEPELRVVGL